MHGRQLATLERVIALARPDSDDILDRLESWTSTHDIELLRFETGEEINDDRLEGPETTLAISIGGDGTFLKGVRAFALYGIPLLGVNFGTLAFLARVDPRDLDAALTEVLSGRATVNTRQQYRGRAGDIDATGINEVFLETHPPAERHGTKVGSLHVFVDDEYVGEYFRSGLIVSTPIGSTGRAFSNHGPIHYPEDNHTLQIVPHETISAAVDPIVVSQSAAIRIVPDAEFDLDVDGGRQFERVEPGTVIHVTGADQPAQVIRTSYDDPFITALVDKLDWGLREVDDQGPVEALAAELAETEAGFGAGGDGTASELYPRAARVAVEAAESVGEPLRALHGRVERVEYKTDRSDIVTEADHQADHIIRTAIESEFPTHTIQSEEHGEVEPAAGYSWLIDPLDGAGNFAHGNPNYAVSIALLDEGVRVVGVVYSPESYEMFHGIAANGAYQNGQPIAPTDRDRLAESMLLSGYDPDGGFLQAFYQEPRGSGGSAARRSTSRRSPPAAPTPSGSTTPSRGTWPPGSVSSGRSAAGRPTRTAGSTNSGRTTLRCRDRCWRATAPSTTPCWSIWTLSMSEPDRLRAGRTRAAATAGGRSGHPGSPEQPQRRERGCERPRPGVNRA